ncbi:MAG: acyl-CoA desaturase [Deltaproteobacteria bacterium]|nr:acyl-CoA desaturase [Deltaproteobacteria bacterium]
MKTVVRPAGHAQTISEFEWLAATPFILVHLAVFGALWSGVTLGSVVTCIALYWIRMFGVTGGYHRYFAHRTYKTSRFVQFLLAVVAQSSAQRGALWWAAHHRDHHKYSDTEKDVHSPVLRSVFYAHVGWVYDHNGETKLDRIRDFAKYPELMWLDKYWLLPPIALGVLCFVLGGWPGLFIGFCLSTVLCWHGTFTINSLSHVFGSRRYKTSDQSRNNIWLALITMGEGWHNNHHHYMHSTRQGFFWWEIDMTYYVLKVMSAFRLVWDLKAPPQWAVRGLQSAREMTPEPTPIPTDPISLPNPATL